MAKVSKLVRRQLATLDEQGALAVKLWQLGGRYRPLNTG